MEVGCFKSASLKTLRGKKTFSRGGKSALGGIYGEGVVLAWKMSRGQLKRNKGDARTILSGSCKKGAGLLDRMRMHPSLQCAGKGKWTGALWSCVPREQFSQKKIVRIDERKKRKVKKCVWSRPRNVNTGQGSHDNDTSAVGGEKVGKGDVCWRQP